MNPEVGHLVNLAVEYIQKGDLNSSECLLKQAFKLMPNNSEIFRLLGVIFALKDDPHKALKMFDSSIKKNPNNFLSHSNRGNILKDLSKYDSALKSFNRAITLRPDYAEVYSNKGNLLQSLEQFDAAIEHYKKAISLDPNNPDFYGNLGNAYQEKLQYDSSIACYEKAISLNPTNPKFFCGLGNAYQEKLQYDSSIACYEKAISLDPNNPDFYGNLGHVFWRLAQLKSAKINYEKALTVDTEHAESHNNLAHLELYQFSFEKGWSHYEYRWLTQGINKLIPFITSKPKWNGDQKNGRLLIWAEQGIGDQILYGSMLRDFESYPQEKIVSVNRKLIPIFQRSFPNMNIIDSELSISDDLYDEQIPFGSLGKLFRPNLKSFDTGRPFYLTSKNFNQSKSKVYQKVINCGISWKSNRTKIGDNKSMSLMEMTPLLELDGITFINLQYGDISDEIYSVNAKVKTPIQIVKGVNLFEDIDGVLDIIDECNIVITTSNSTAHLAGAIGKEVLLLLPFGYGRFWYWHDIDGVSLWYPSIRVFKQEKEGDWSAPIKAVKAYLEDRFAI